MIISLSCCVASALLSLSRAALPPSYNTCLGPKVVEKVVEMTTLQPGVLEPSSKNSSGAVAWPPERAV